MGNLEKAGIGVVVVLLGVILVVAFISDAGTTEKGKVTTGGTAETAKPQPPVDPGSLGARRVIFGSRGNPVVQNPPIHDVASKKPEVEPVGGSIKDLAKSTVDGSASRPIGSPEPEIRPAPSEPVKPPAPLVASAWPKDVKLADGQGLWSAVERTYGKGLTAAMIKKVIAENKISDAKKLKAGMTLKMPAPPAASVDSDIAKEGTTSTDAAPTNLATSTKNKPAATPLVSAKSKVSPNSEFIPFDPGNGTTAANSKEKPVAALTKPSSGFATYVMKKGETLAEVVRRQYGNEKRLKEVADLNKVSDVAKLGSGSKIRLPPKK